MINLAYNRSFFLKMRNPEYRKSVESLLWKLLREDVGKGDITTLELVPEGKVKAEIVANEKGVLAGGEEFRWFCRENGILVKQFVKDGERFGKNEKLFVISGPGRRIFSFERTGLNLLQRMSGIASETKEIVDKVMRAGHRPAITGTRKTPWGCLDKKAVTIGGGYSHRLGLWESFMIKDNHLASLSKRGIQDPAGFAIEKAWNSRKLSVFIEIEVKTVKHALRAAEKFRELKDKGKREKPCIIMLDNMKPKVITKVIRLLKENNLYEYVLLEASGGVSKANVLEYAKTGIDACSLGYLTHSVKARDISQEMR